MKNNKKIDEFGREITRRGHVKTLLKQKGEQRFGEIKQYLEEKELPYANNKGLSLLLENMKNSGEIGKKPKSRIQIHPTYYHKPESFDSISSLAQEFRRGILHEITRFPNLPRNENDTNEKFLIRNLIHHYGFYVLFTLIESWKLTLLSTDHGYNSDIRSAWLKNTLPMGGESFLFEEGITDICNLRFYNFDERVSKIYENEKKKIKFQEIETILENMYPVEFKLFNNIRQKSSISAKNRKEWIKKIIQNEQRERRLKKRKK